MTDHLDNLENLELKVRQADIDEQLAVTGAEFILKGMQQEVMNQIAELATLSIDENKIATMQEFGAVVIPGFIAVPATRVFDGALMDGSMRSGGLIDVTRRTFMDMVRPEKSGGALTGIELNHGSGHVPSRIANRKMKTVAAQSQPVAMLATAVSARVKQLHGDSSDHFFTSIQRRVNPEGLPLNQRSDVVSPLSDCVAHVAVLGSSLWTVEDRVLGVRPGDMVLLGVNDEGRTPEYSVESKGPAHQRWDLRFSAERS